MNIVDDKGTLLYELGRTSTSLDDILSKGKDRHFKQSSAVKDGKGVEVGDLVYGVSALSAIETST